MGNPIQEIRIDRRQFLKVVVLGAAGLGVAATVGCGSDNENKNTAKPVSTSTEKNDPIKTPENEGLSEQLGFLPFEVLSDGMPEIDIPDSPYHLQEGFRWVTIRLAVKNLSNEPFTLGYDLLKMADHLFDGAKVTTAQGSEYPTLTNDLGAQIGEVAHTPIIIPPGFRFESLQDNPASIIDPVELYQGAVDEQGNPYDYETYAKLSSCMAFVTAQVPQNATGLKLNIPGYDAIDIDKAVNEIASKPAYDKPQSEFENAIGGSVLTAEGVRVTIKDFKQLEDPQSVIPGPTNKSLYDNYQFYQVVLNYTNPDQGYAHSGKLTMYSVTENGDVYIVYDYSDPNNQHSGYIGFDEIGPGFSKDLIVNVIYPISATDVKFVLQGEELAVFNAPLVAA